MRPQHGSFTVDSPLTLVVDPTTFNGSKRQGVSAEMLLVRQPRGKKRILEAPAHRILAFISAQYVAILEEFERFAHDARRNTEKDYACYTAGTVLRGLS